ncbi:MAG: hypothetical protein JW759_09110 [Candidatus Coatesbacteria bacterium]|nr:hypothetical protein [Candidatus Coatesbacteria bacterium]
MTVEREADFCARIIYRNGGLNRASKTGLVALFVTLCAASPSLSDAYSLYKEVNLIGGYSSSEHWLGNSMSQMNSLGVEYFQRFSNDYGDYLTCDFQLRLAYNSVEPLDDAWAVEVHNAWAEYKLGLGRKLIAGHFAPAFGLEPLVDTHGTLLQTLAPMNIGFKNDWGVGFSDTLGDYDYSLAAQLGSGMSIQRRDSSGLLTGRIGTPTGSDFQYGLSLLYGKTLRAMGMGTFPRPELAPGGAVLKKRVGLDAQYLFGSYLLRGESVYGENDSAQVAGGLVEVDYTVPDLQELKIQLQSTFWDSDLSRRDTEDVLVSAGLEYQVNKDLALRALCSTNTLSNNDVQEEQVFLQVYYYAPF